MYSKEEIQALKREFWNAFAEQYPRKWLLYNTKIKDFSFKFNTEKKKIEVLLAIEHKDPELKKIYFQKIESLKNILRDEFLPEVIFDEFYPLENGKIIGKIWVEKHGLTFHNRAHWEEIFDFFADNMTQFELFFYEYEDYIRDLDTNT